jgi:LPXTG-motif cell wall-anchored protein
MSRGRAVAWAALALGLLVLPPAISAAQEGAESQASTQTAAGEETTSPAVPDQGEGGAQPPGNGEQPEVGGDGGRADSSAQQASDTGGASYRRARAKEPTARLAASLTVSIGDNFYSPRSVSIEVGDTVTWVNNGQAQHSATASDGSFDTGVFGPGGSRSHTFNQAGTFDYFCTVHGQAQSGTVTVASASGAGGGGDGGGGAAGPSEEAAVASPGAAGDGSTLPATGDDVLLPLAVGLALLLGGLGLRLTPRR